MSAGFVWLSRAGLIPARWDLRLLGWTLSGTSDDIGLPALFDGRQGFRQGDWRNLTAPGLIVSVGVDCSEERAAMLTAGLGDALPASIAVGELALRLTRLSLGAGAVPRRRQVGPLMLDLLHRDAQIGARWLALHPREFALLWRLADNPGERVARQTLLADVWRLNRVPETNSLEVHVSRLRAKLAVSKAAWLVETDPRGGYRLAAACRDRDRWTVPAPLPTVGAS